MYALLHQQFGHQAAIATRQHVILQCYHQISGFRKIFCGRFIDRFGKPRINQRTIKVFTQFLGRRFGHTEHRSQPQKGYLALTVPFEIPNDLRLTNFQHDRFFLNRHPFSRSTRVPDKGRVILA